MAKKTSDKDTNVTTAKKVEDVTVVSEQKEENVVNLEKVDTPEDKKDVSEVVTPETISENVEKISVPQDVEQLDKPEAPSEMVNESETNTDSKESEEKSSEDKTGYTIDAPAIAELIDSEDSGDISITPTYVACPPIEGKFVVVDDTPTYTAQCPPKPATEKPDAYVAQRPY